MKKRKYEKKAEGADGEESESESDDLEMQAKSSYTSWSK